MCVWGGGGGVRACVRVCVRVLTSLAYACLQHALMCVLLILVQSSCTQLMHIMSLLCLAGILFRKSPFCLGVLPCCSAMPNYLIWYYRFIEPEALSHFLSRSCPILSVVLFHRCSYILFRRFNIHVYRVRFTLSHL